MDVDVTEQRQFNSGLGWRCVNGAVYNNIGFARVAGDQWQQRLHRHHQFLNHGEPPERYASGGRRADVWVLAVRYLGDGQKWPLLQQLNGGIDPRKLRVGMTLPSQLGSITFVFGTVAIYALFFFAGKLFLAVLPKRGRITL